MTLALITISLSIVAASTFAWTFTRTCPSRTPAAQLARVSLFLTTMFGFLAFDQETAPPANTDEIKRFWKLLTPSYPSIAFLPEMDVSIGA